MATKFDKVRDEILEEISEIFRKKEYDVLRTGSQEICVPIIGEENEEGYLVLTFKVPKGSRDGEPYDGYSVAEEYKMKCEEKKRKAKENAEKKAKKIERDKKMREEKARLKAERENKGE